MTDLQRPRVFVTRIIPERGLRMIRERFDAEVWPDPAPPPKQLIAQKVRDVDALASLITDTIDREVFDAAPNLKIVAQYAVGYDNIDVKEATKRGIHVTNTPGVLTETTADFAWALLMAVARRVTEANRYIRSGKWKVGWQPTMLLGRDVYGATLGIIGLGRIGSAVASRAKGFDMKILYYDMMRRPELERQLGVEYADLDGLLQRSDFVTVHVPLTDETYHMLGARQFRKMKKTAYLINNSRGSVIDEKALHNALKEEEIAGVALDVFEQEPTPTDNPLLQLDNVIAAPHISSASHETRSRMAEMVAENLIAYFEGKVPPNLVNPGVLKLQGRI